MQELEQDIDKVEEKTPTITETKGIYQLFRIIN